MSRSTQKLITPHPSNRWFEWKGGDNFGIEYYDKEKKERIAVSLPFTFLLLEETGGVTGYSDKQKKSVRSNEIMQGGELIVKYHTGEVIAKGHWADIKEKVTSKNVGGKFCTNAYIAYKDGGDLQIGVLRLSGCALGPWFDFTKKNRETVISPFDGKTEISKIYSGAIVMKAGAKDKTGSVEFTPPAFSLVQCSQESNLAALALSSKVDKFLSEYFKRAPVESSAQHEEEQEPEPERDELATEPEPDNIPF